MRKEIQMEEMMRLLNRYKAHEITCQRIAQNPGAKQVMDKYQLERDRRKARIYEGSQSFTVPFDSVSQICIDTGMSRGTRDKYLLFTISYELFHYISLNITC